MKFNSNYKREISSFNFGMNIATSSCQVCHSDKADKWMQNLEHSQAELYNDSLIIAGCLQSDSLGIQIWIVLYINGLVQERRNFIANALELRLSCTDPLIYIWVVLFGLSKLFAFLINPNFVVLCLHSWYIFF